MKIKTLTFQAFGPYLEKQVLDFAHLNEAELFLVTGDTGAGKTTIFDAICFALYGVSSGNMRQPSQFRNQKATSEIETYVSLCFEIRHHEYTIIRYPNYPREGRKTESPHRVYLQGYGEHEIEGITAVASKVKKIIGVDADEFRQVAMIAQGQFTRLIHAPSKEREAIFRELFSTQAYARFQDQLKKGEREKKEIYEKNRQTLDTYVGELQDLDGEDPLIYLENKQTETNEVLSSAKGRLEALDEKLIEVNQQLEKALNQEELKRQLATLQKESEALKARQTAMQALQKENAILELCRGIVRDYEHLKKQSKRLADLKQQLEEAQAKKNTLEKEQLRLQAQAETIDALTKENEQQKRQLEKVLEDLAKASRYEQAKETLTLAQADYEAKAQQMALYQQEKEVLLNNMETQKTELDALRQLEVDQLNIIHQTTDLKRRQQNLMELDKIKEKLTSFLTSIENKQAKYEQAKLAFNKINEEHAYYEQQYFANMAGLLAKDLQEGLPCPVCGATHHPKLAVYDKEVMTKEQLDAHRHKVAASAKLTQDLQVALSTQQQSYEVEKAHFEAQLGEESLADKWAKYYEDYQTFEKARDLYRQRTDRQNALQKSLQLLNKKKDHLLSQEEPLQNQLTTLMQAKQKAQEAFDFMRGAFNEDYVGIEALKKQEADLKQALQENEVVLTTYHKDLEAYQKEAQQNQGRMQALQDAFNHAKQAYDESQADYKRSLNNHHLSEDDFNAHVSRLDQLEANQKKCRDYEDACIINQSKLNEVQLGLEKLADIDGQAVRLAKEKLDQDSKAEHVLIEKCHWQLAQWQKQKEQIEKAKQDLAKSQSHYQQIYEISQLVSGQNRLRMTFESYILTAYFEAILQRANLRFIAMTNGRYALLRRQENGGGRALQGLDLSVMDYENGAPRDIKTLSGGETFKAALSLSLGMADLISENAGGIELDTLFIDEGFGSLDAKSLDQAIDTLVELKQTHKVVGIISHVDKLQERLPAKIVVTHQKDTSSAKIS